MIRSNEEMKLIVAVPALKEATSELLTMLSKDKNLNYENILAVAKIQGIINFLESDE